MLSVNCSMFPFARLGSRYLRPQRDWVEPFMRRSMASLAGINGKPPSYLAIPAKKLVENAALSTTSI